MSTPVARRIRTFYFYRPDGSLCGRSRCSDHPGYEASVRAAAAERGEGVLECDDELDLSHDRVDMTTGELIDPVDYEFAAALDAKWQNILSAFPQLANPVPPVPVPKSLGGTERFSVAEFWQDFTQRAASGEWRLRAPTDDLTNLVGPFRGHGTCLAPVLPGGELQWVDPQMPAQDEDVVLVRLDALELQRIRERCRDKPGWMETYGEANPLCTKLLKAFAGTYWLVTAGSMFELGRNHILGVLRKTFIDGRPAFEVPNILPNAATAVDSVEDSSTSLINGGGAVLQASLPALKMQEGYHLQATATFDVWITNFGGGTPEFFVTVSAVVGGAIASGQSAFPTATTSPGQRITLQCEVPIDAADDASGLLVAVVWTGAAPAGTAEMRNGTLRVERLKR